MELFFVLQYLGACGQPPDRKAQQVRDEMRTSMGELRRDIAAIAAAVGARPVGSDI